jgi:hypothetical protein
MSLSTEPSPSRSLAAEERRADLLVRLPMLLIGLGVSVYGLAWHNSLCWNLGPLLLGSTIATWISDHKIRHSEPPLATFEQAVLSATTYLLVVIPFLIVSLGIMFLFPSWFRDLGTTPR